MKRYDSLWQLFRDLVFGDPDAKQTERLDAAIKAAAEAEGDLLVARTMRDHYASAAARINHSQKWWEYAATRQKAQDYADECDLLFARYEAVVARGAAEHARMLQLHNKSSVAGSEDQA